MFRTLAVIFVIAIFFALFAEASQPETTSTQVINLGRTSLAAVTASSVNGGRSMDNIFYGILNAFDGGNNWHNHINYTQWLSDYGAAGTYAEVEFDDPMTVTSIVTESAPPFSVRLIDAEGIEEVYNAKDSLTLNPPARNIRRVRLTFENNSEGVVRVNEIQIMGLVPPGTNYEVRSPRTVPSRRNSDLMADEVFSTWLYPYLTTKRHTTQETEDKIIYTYYLEDVPVLRVTINKQDGSKRVERFSRDNPLKE
ncbi:MAG: hypothetical protein MN733_02110 [Nitrososphaera sp.]|nr:hypothetical protein [Nitrososphaera sp.]